MGCTGKRRYLSQQDAATAMFILKRHKGCTDWMNVYQCQFCHGFHFGHSPHQAPISVIVKQLEREFYAA